ncbi:MAG: hypothetical protein LRZ94_01185 [Candidatus Pacebacteria bacterium]|nr:hypothetical protein [Candidatus Paceibacterota bacterium]
MENHGANHREIFVCVLSCGGDGVFTNSMGGGEKMLKTRRIKAVENLYGKCFEDILFELYVRQRLLVTDVAAKLLLPEELIYRWVMDLGLLFDKYPECARKEGRGNAKGV